jgi:hypothetical protein
MPLNQHDIHNRHREFSDPASGDLPCAVPEYRRLISGWRCAAQVVVFFDLERFLDPAQLERSSSPELNPITGGLPDTRFPRPKRGFNFGQHGLRAMCYGA